MVSKTVVIKNEQGLHMRPAGVLAKEAAKYKSNISLVFNGKKINAKSVMNIIVRCLSGYKKYIQNEQYYGVLPKIFS